EITDGEYTATRTTEQGSRHLTGQHESDFVEYFAYDDEYLVARVQVEDFKYPWNYRIKDEDKSGAGYARAVARF
ncbi:MAG: hypothetical protein II281_01630, partial [Alistipes sp.]|nr:hypothetical protein [Alistipes sp.]